MPRIGEFNTMQVKIGVPKIGGAKIGEYAKRAEDNKKVVAAHANLEKMMKK